MKRPNALIQLLGDLQSEDATTSTVVTIGGSYAKLYAFGDSDEHILLTPSECEALFDDAETVQLLYDALGMPEECIIELHKVSVSDEVKEAIEELFDLDES